MVQITTETLKTPAELAAHCRVHRQTVYDWFSKGLERIKLGGRVYTSLEALQRFGTGSPEHQSEEDKAAALEAETAAASFDRRQNGRRRKSTTAQQRRRGGNGA